MLIPGNFILGGNVNQPAGVTGPTYSGKVGSNQSGVGPAVIHQRSNSKNYFHGKETSEEALTKIYLDNNIIATTNSTGIHAKKVPKAYLQKVLADNRSKTSLKQVPEGSGSGSIINTSFNQIKR